ncbi:MAG: hypothetical protein ACRDQ2_01865 [Gaiellales bacterium]
MAASKLLSRGGCGGGAGGSDGDRKALIEASFGEASSQCHGLADTLTEGGFDLTPTPRPRPDVPDGHVMKPGVVLVPAGEFDEGVEVAVEQVKVIEDEAEVPLPYQDVIAKWTDQSVDVQGTMAAPEPVVVDHTLQPAT